MRASRSTLSHLDAKWFAKWQSSSKQAKTPTRGKWYQLCMFPYPSGQMHVGHLRVYSISDTLSRFRKMNGYDVLSPMGWDAFGLPAENAAQQRNVKASDWTYANIKAMHSQFDQMLCDFDWSKELITCHPDYYKHTQRLFLEFYKAGLAYRAPGLVNWDPVDETVLANEQVDAQGRSWRSGALVETRELEQWYLKITEYGDALDRDLSTLDQWPSKVKTMQKNWIGKSSGAELTLADNITVFTTRADTLAGAMYVALAINHPIVLAEAETNAGLKAFISKPHETGSKDGFRLSQVIKNPLTGAEMPLFCSPYVLGDYGTGAVMGVPAHDQRDSDFWELHGTTAPINVIQEAKSLPYTEKYGTLNEASGFAGLSIADGAKAIMNKLGAKEKTRYRLRDWLISRQRYWGAPIPIINCSSCGTVPVPEKDLPVLLPENHSGPLSQCKEFMETTCPSCGGEATRDPDTMDTFVDSSWYFLRFTDPDNKDLPFSKDRASELMPVDMYLGGVEHAILHLLYSRFWTKFLVDRGLIENIPNSEPFKRLVTQGMVHGKTFINTDNGRFLMPDELGPNNTVKATGKPAGITFEKMSKSKYNGVDPSEVISKYGADAVRAHVLFQAPVNDVLEWHEDNIVGVTRWLSKLQALVSSASECGSAPTSAQVQAWNECCALVSNITKSLEDTLALNTVISDFMKLTRAVGTLKGSELAWPATETLVKVIAPVCPANAEEAWEKLLEIKKQPWSSVFAEEWPLLEPISSGSAFNYNVMINGKRIMSFASESDVQEQVLEELSKEPKTKPLLERGIKRVVFVPAKSLVNILTN
ncbi:Leucine--tRNA ligase, mitochondrial [Wickerhamiella sorbophila]|uniref:leucine--tRNA ligase n=1 Tax=Wickerhamiella sorbophila TaxID=45607 RepID=A0A2T0FJD5_9ASCO|nr:Leucine--tRNA ligase, mitochondrial [Wickerhamiella sorbophila]PRT55049.1 Leucine--tRNA ligase, mitochondrial [Wickerhamiella sorbophila]